MTESSTRHPELFILHPMAVYLFSPAKVNIGLRILSRRSDGFHELESLFWPLDFGDDLFLEHNNTNRVRMSWAEIQPRPLRVPTSKENTMSRVLSLLRRSDTSRWSVRVQKKVPMGSGLGGGSSNAGTLLRYLQSKRGYSDELTKAIAVRVGADTSFFLKAVPAWVSGIGEKVSPLNFSGRVNPFFLLVIPKQKLMTQKVFRIFSKAKRTYKLSSETEWANAKWDEKTFSRYLEHAKNDLEETARNLSPGVGTILNTLRKTERAIYTGVSGSGSTCFSIYPDAGTALDAANALSPFCRKYDCKMVLSKTYRVKTN